MSVLSGYGPGARNRRKDERYREAVGRQQTLCDRGWYHRLHDNPSIGIVTASPAPADELMRADDRAKDRPPDYRQDARAAARRRVRNAKPSGTGADRG